MERWWDRERERETYAEQRAAEGYRSADGGRSSPAEVKFTCRHAVRRGIRAALQIPLAVQKLVPDLRPAEEKKPATRRGEHESGIPVISIDYLLMNENGDDHNYPTPALHDSGSEGVWAILCRQKGKDDHAVRRVTEIKTRLGT